MSVSKKLWNKTLNELKSLRYNRSINEKIKEDKLERLGLDLSAGQFPDVIRLSQNLLVSERQGGINVELDDLVRERIARDIGNALRHVVKFHCLLLYNH